MCRTCSQCGLSGHNSRTCTGSACGVATAAGGKTPIENGIMLFGVRVVAADSGGGGGGSGGGFRKSASMNNLSQFENQFHESNGGDVAAGYASDDLVHASDQNRDRKRGVPWTEEEHRMFLLGLEKVGKGDWRGISRTFVKSRTPAQVASHAQKYFIRRNNHNRRRRRSSLFDMTTDSVMESTMNEDHIFSLQHNDSMEDLTLGQSSKIKSCSSSKFSRLIPSIPIPSSSKMAKLNLDEPSGDIESLHLSLNLSTTPMSMEEKATPSVRRSSAFEAMADNFNNNGDSISVS